MTFIEIFLTALVMVILMMSLLWVFSVIIRNASIVDIFWGFGFVVITWIYFLLCEGNDSRKILIVILVTLWGLRLSIFLAWRNIGKGEDFRYQQFRKNYGPQRYWWVSFFQVFLLQGGLMWLISAPLLGAQYAGVSRELGLLDYAGILLWCIGFLFETGGDFQLARFKANPANKGRVLNIGFWRYTRHPNYFGDAAVWWGFGLICVAAGSYIPVLGSVIMTILLLKVSGVAMLEKTLKESKAGYREYIETTSAFFPWPPNKG